MKTVILTIGACEAGGYPVRVFDDGAPVPAAPAAFLPMTLGTALPATPSDAAPTPAGIRTFLINALQPSPQLAEYGRLLYEVLEACSPLNQWLTNRQAAADGLRTLMNVDDKDLGLLPWELMLDAAGDPLFNDPDHPISWGRPTASTKPVSYKWPIRLLIAVGSGPGNDILANDEAEAIEDKLHDYFGVVEARVVTQPTGDELVEQFQRYRPHIFHFIGHTVSIQNKPALLFAGKDGASNWTLGHDDVPRFVNKWVPRLVVLNACRSGMKSQAAVSSLAGSFSARKVAAVIGMQADIRGDEAARLGAAFYVNLAKGMPVDVALAEARAEVGQGKALQRRDWCLPRLTLTAPPEEVLRMEFPISDKQRNDLNLIPEFSRLRRFVDRQKPRQFVCGTDGPRDPDDWPTPLLIIEGESDVGKSWLLYWCLRCWMLWNWTVAYVSMGSGPSRDFLQTLRLIRDGYKNASSSLYNNRHQNRIDRKAFNAFNHTLNNLGLLIKGSPVPPLPAGAVEINELRAEADAPWPGPDRTQAPELIEIFRGALKAAAGALPVVIALDHLNVSPDDFKDLLIPELIARVAQKDIPGVYMVLVLTTGDKTEALYREELDKQLGESFRPLPLPLFSPTDFVPLAVQTFRRGGRPVNSERVQAFKALAALYTVPWKACVLETVLKAIPPP